MIYVYIGILIGILIVIMLLIMDILARMGRLPDMMGFGEARESSDRLRAIQKITSKISQAESFESIINAIIHITTDALNAEVGSVMLFNEDSEVTSPRPKSSPILYCGEWH